jgi:hypothetical protein
LVWRVPSYHQLAQLFLWRSPGYWHHIVNHRQ